MHRDGCPERAQRRPSLVEDERAFASRGLASKTARAARRSAPTLLHGFLHSIPQERCFCHRRFVTPALFSLSIANTPGDPSFIPRGAAPAGWTPSTLPTATALEERFAFSALRISVIRSLPAACLAGMISSLAREYRPWVITEIIRSLIGRY